MLKIEPYNPTLHLEHVSRLAKERDLPMGESDLYSTTGVVLSQNDEYLGFVFVYLTNSSIAYLDNLIVTSSVSKEERASIVDKLCHEATIMAREYKAKYILVSTSSQTACKSLEKEQYMRFEDEAKMYIRRAI